MQNTITRLDALRFVLSNYEMPEDVASTLRGMADKLADRTPSTSDLLKQRADAKIMDTIYQVLADAERMRIGEITSKVNETLGESYSSNKISALVSKMKAENRVVRTEEKRIAYFSVAR